MLLKEVKANRAQRAMHELESSTPQRARIGSDVSAASDTSDIMDGPSPIRAGGASGGRRTSAPPGFLQGAVFRVSEGDEEGVDGKPKEDKPFWMDVKPWNKA